MNYDPISAMPALNAKTTLELLSRRVRERGDLPGFSKAISAIRSAISGEEDHEFNMTKTVLSDPGLTQKVLRLANSAMYSAFGQNINTVSKAVLVLGTESIGHLAMGSKLIDGLSKVSVNSTHARQEMEKAVLAGNIARQVTSFASARDAEEAVVCAMLHDLGRMMTAFYLHDYWVLVQNRCADQNIEEAQATLDIFGISLPDLGRVIAQQWGLPTGILDSLTDVSAKKSEEPLNHADWLAAVSTMSSQCATVICASPGDSSGKSLSGIVENYSEMLGMDPAGMLAAVETAKQVSQEESAESAQQAQPIVPEIKKTVVASSQLQIADTVRILTRGVSDMRDVVDSATLSQLMTMALETIYQGLRMSRAIFFLHNRNEAKYFARMGFGEKIPELMPALVFNAAYQPDVFHAALAHHKSIFVKDARAPAFFSKLPRWWRQNLTEAKSFLILPLTTNRHSGGFIYGDWEESTSINELPAAQLLLINELCAMLAAAIVQPGRGPSPVKEMRKP